MIILLILLKFLIIKIILELNKKKLQNYKNLRYRISLTNSISFLIINKLILLINNFWLLNSKIILINYQYYWYKLII